MRKSSLFAALFFALPVQLTAQTVGPAPEPNASAARTETPDQNDKVICKQEKKLGSRVASRKTCLTARQWREQSALAQEELGRRTRTGNGDN